MKFAIEVSCANCGRVTSLKYQSKYKSSHADNISSRLANQVRANPGLTANELAEVYGFKSTTSLLTRLRQEVERGTIKRTGHPSRFWPVAEAQND